MGAQKPRSFLGSAGGSVVLGVLTIAPLAVTWFILDFLFRLLARIGVPMVRAIVRALEPEYGGTVTWIADETFLSLIAIVAVLAILWLIGWTASRMIGRRLIAFFEAIIVRIPFVDGIYKAAKKFLTVAGPSPEDGKKVVLIEFPCPGMKAVGLVTRLIKDSSSGASLAVVYVPTSPNPTSGYIEIVPVENLIPTDWTFDQAMAFVVTGGSSAPDTISYSVSETKNFVGK